MNIPAKCCSNWPTGWEGKEQNVKVFGSQLQMPSDQMVIVHVTLNGSGELKTEIQVMTSILMWNVQLFNGSTLSCLNIRISSLKTKQWKSCLKQQKTIRMIFCWLLLLKGCQNWFLLYITSVDTEMCCPKGKCGCQYFILLTFKKKMFMDRGPGFF
jgi:hypothetical protein